MKSLEISRPSEMIALMLGKAYRKALVTGASSGLGKAFAEMLLEEGVEVWTTSREAEKLPERPNRHPVSLDLLDEGSLDGFVNSFLKDHPSLDLVINNAGYGVFYPFETFPFEEIGGQISVLLNGPITICRTVYPRMKERNKGVIVNVSSLATEFPLPFMSLYNAAKSGLSAFSRSLMAEARGSGVSIIDFQPGDFRTDFNVAMRRERDLMEGSEQLEKAWKALENNLRKAPEASLARRKLRKILLKPRSGTFLAGSVFQTVAAPFLSRFVSRETTDFFIRKYYGLD